MDLCLFDSFAGYPTVEKMRNRKPSKIDDSVNVLFW